MNIALRMTSPSQTSILIGVAFLHALLLLVAMRNGVTPITLPKPKERLMVQTIQLNDKPIPIASPKPIPIIQEIPEVVPIIEEEDEPIEVAEPQEAEPQIIAEPVTQPQPKPKEEKKVEPKPKPAVKKKEEPKKNIKPKAKETPKKKSKQEKPIQKKEDTQAKQEKAKQEAARLKEEKAKEAARQANLEKQRKLLQKAKESIAKIDKSQHNFTASTTSLVPASIEKLHIDALPSGGAKSSFNTREIGYVDELVSRLKLMLRLPEYGAVKVQLTLERTGKVAKVVIVSSENAANKKYIEKTLPTVSFTPFGDNFGTQQQYTFEIHLNNDI